MAQNKRSKEQEAAEVMSNIPDGTPAPSLAGPGQTAAPRSVKVELPVLQESERRFRASMEHSPIGMALTRMDGSWIDVNPALCNFLGYSKDQLMQAGFKNVTHPDDREATIMTARQMVASRQKSVTLEKRYIHADGRVLTGLLSLTVVRDDDDLPMMYISQIQDITAARRLDHLKSEFITTVNHELRTPLTGIIGALSLLEKLSANADSGNTQQLVSVASRNAARLKSLLDDVLDMETLSSDIFEPLLQDVDVTEVIVNAISAVEFKATAAAVAVECAPFDGALSCSVDSVKLTRVVSILISNAIKFSPQGGVVTVDAAIRQDVIRVSVCNTGRPIPEEMRSYIFQPFVQADPTSRRRKEGAGLGLAVAKHLADHIGAELGYVSDADRTRFWLDIPIAGAALSPLR